MNYDSSAVVDDGSCQPFRDGCMDATALNYQPQANREPSPQLCVYDPLDRFECPFDLSSTQRNAIIAFKLGNTQSAPFVGDCADRCLQFPLCRSFKYDRLLTRCTLYSVGAGGPGSENLGGGLAVGGQTMRLVRTT